MFFLGYSNGLLLVFAAVAVCEVVSTTVCTLGFSLAVRANSALHRQAAHEVAGIVGG
jgi:hypothetical protein